MSSRVRLTHSEPGVSWTKNVFKPPCLSVFKAIIDRLQKQLTPTKEGGSLSVLVHTGMANSGRWVLLESMIQQKHLSVCETGVGLAHSTKQAAEGILKALGWA